MTSDYHAERNLWRAVLMQAISDVYGPYKPGVSPERNKRIAEQVWENYEKRKATGETTGKNRLAPHRFSMPSLETKHARAWFKGGGQDFKTVLSSCEYDPQSFRKKMIPIIEEIEQLEEYFKNKKRIKS